MLTFFTVVPRHKLRQRQRQSENDILKSQTERPGKVFPEPAEGPIVPEYELPLPDGELPTTAPEAYYYGMYGGEQLTDSTLQNLFVHPQMSISILFSPLKMWDFSNMFYLARFLDI